MVGIVFGCICGKIGSEGFWNVSILIMIFCIMLFLFFLILYIRIVLNQLIVYVNCVCEWIVRVIINVFGGIELFSVFLEESQYNQEILKDFKNVIIVFICLSFMWWFLGVFLDCDVENVEGDRICYLLSFGI